MMRMLLWFGIYVLVAVTVTGLGAWLLVAPRRAGDHLHEWYVIVPSADSTFKRVAFRVVGAALVMFGFTFGMSTACRVLRLILG